MQELIVGMMLLGWLQLVTVSSGKNGLLCSAGWATLSVALLYLGAGDSDAPLHTDIPQFFAALWPVMMLTFWTGWFLGGLIRPVLRLFRWAAAIR